MKRVLHYLWFDARRWRALLFVEWGLAGLYILLTLLGQQELKEPWESGYLVEVPAQYQQAAGVCRIIMMLCAMTLCVFAGGTDSPVRSRSWQRTRPGRGWKLGAAHGLFILLSVVMPVTAAYAGELAVLKFNASTAGSESLQMFELMFALAAMVLVWSVMSPRFVGVLIFYAVIVFFWGLRSSGPWPPAAVVILILALPPLCGLRGLWRRESRRTGILYAVLTGVSFWVVVASMPLAQGVTEWMKGMGKLQKELFGGDQWELTATGPARGSGRPEEFIRVHGEKWSLDLAGTILPVALDSWGTRVSGISWRSDAGAPWSPWYSVEADVYPAGNQEKRVPGVWKLRFSLPADGGISVPALQKGELRFKVTLTLVESKSIRLPVKAGVFARDEGWTFEVLQVPSAKALVVHTGAFHSHNPPMLQLAQQPPDLIGAKQPWLTDNFSPVMTRSWVVEPTDNAKNPEPALALYYVGQQEKVDTILHVTAVDLSPPTLHAAPLETVPENTPVKKKDSVQPGREFYPWLTKGSEEIPPPEASETEVTAFLSRQLVSNQAVNLIKLDRDPEKEKRFKALVERWLGLFVEMAVRHPGSHGEVFRLALVEETPEERREEVLRRIPDSPELTEVAEVRQWLPAAKPYILQLVQRTGTIPKSIIGLCRRYRDPSFHPAMRNSFTADLPTLRYWQSMPDLAAELPERLARMRVEFLTKGFLSSNESIEVLLYTGDAAVFGELLRQWQRSYRPAPKGRDPQSGPAPLLKVYVRDQQGEPVPFDGRHPDFTAGTTAADYTFDAARHCFVRKPASPKP